MSAKILAVVLAASILVFVFELIRREKLTFKYAFGWILISASGLFFAVFDQWLYRLAAWLGFQVPSNFIFFVLLGAFVFLSLLLTIFLCQQNSHNDTISQKIGMLEFELEQLKEKSKD